MIFLYLANPIVLFINVGNEEGIFEINAMSGVLRTIAPLDREERSQYILSIQATDSAGINSLSSVTEVHAY